MVIPNASQFVLSNVAAKKLLMSSSDVSSVQYAPLNGTFAFETKQIETRAFTMEVSSLYLRLSTLSQIEFKTFRRLQRKRDDTEGRPAPERRLLGLFCSILLAVFLDASIM